ncbi:hypothetical protein [Methylobacterium symbioticum]|uniref:hypothetical protein n=1 Tax=Methylobacterium symbioticum TaxID=2584084 RepID=UPI0011574A97|nr:hypothetical protein [Methylobacterium symbioticum]
MSTAKIPTSTDEELSPADRDRARRAARARLRRAKAGATPRTESVAAELRFYGVSPNSYYSRQRRKRLREERDGAHSNTYPVDAAASQPSPDQLPHELHSNTYPSATGGDAQQLVASNAAEFEAVLARLRAAAPAALLEFAEIDPAFSLVRD